MSDKQREDHWDRVYREKAPDQTSWYQVEPSLSLAMIARAGLQPDAAIIDIGAGRSSLVDRLVEAGFRQLSVLDISSTALEEVRRRLPTDPPVRWIVSDIANYCPDQSFSLWHDRALFHFLTEHSDREAYKMALRAALLPAAQLLIGTFALDGPLRCSGLEVVRYDADSLTRELGPEFELIEEQDEVHLTPWGSEQRFCFCRFRYLGGVDTK
jgi:hypothetical protein